MSRLSLTDMSFLVLAREQCEPRIKVSRHAPECGMSQLQGLSEQQIGDLQLLTQLIMIKLHAQLVGFDSQRNVDSKLLWFSNRRCCSVVT